MTLLTTAQTERLLYNGSPEQREKDHHPVVKLFSPDANATWLLTELLPDEDGIAFGLCDLGHGEPELGYVSLAELATVRGRLGLPVERDLYFEAEFPLSVYTKAARLCRRITTDRVELTYAEDVMLGEEMNAQERDQTADGPKPI